MGSMECFYSISLRTSSTEGHENAWCQVTVACMWLVESADASSFHDVMTDQLVGDVMGRDSEKLGWDGDT